MATLGYQSPATSGTPVTFIACAAGGDKIGPLGRGCILLRNNDASSKTVTVVVPGNDPYGSARPDFSVVVPAGATVAIGPFGSDLADTDGLVALTYSAVTSLSIAALAL